MVIIVIMGIITICCPKKEEKLTITKSVNSDVKYVRRAELSSTGYDSLVDVLPVSNSDVLVGLQSQSYSNSKSYSEYGLLMEAGSSVPISGSYYQPSIIIVCDECKDRIIDGLTCFHKDSCSKAKKCGECGVRIDVQIIYHLKSCSLFNNNIDPNITFLQMMIESEQIQEEQEKIE